MGVRAPEFLDITVSNIGGESPEGPKLTRFVSRRRRESGTPWGLEESRMSLGSGGGRRTSESIKIGEIGKVSRRFLLIYR